MIARLTGQVIEREARAVILDVHGVGYRVDVLKSLRETIKRGDQLSLRIYHQVSEDSETLYGFAKKEDLEFFELLLTVPSVGPRTALNILDIAPPPTLAQAVIENDTALLTKVSGVGRKTAERIIVELKGKIATRPAKGVPGSLQQEVISALTSIGYTATQAREVVSKLPPTVTTVEEAVRAVLQEKVK
jgi:Holliday junction DNA helicase RuvA